MSPLLLCFFQSEVRDSYDHFFWGMVALCGTVGFAIAAFLLISAWRFRRRDPNELGSQRKNYIPVEAAWIGIPFLCFIGMFLLGAKLYFKIERPPNDAEDVYVTAKQWMWKLQHTDGKREIDTLHVPAGKAIRLNMISEDVIHSFYAPAFRIKQDVLPGRYTTIWFKADKPGTYHLFCAEYCGTNHSQMTGWIYVLDQKQYNAWLEQGAAEGSLASPAKRCSISSAAVTATIMTVTVRAPNLVGLYGTTVNLTGGGTVLADDTYVRQSILQPKTQSSTGSRT